MLNLSSALRAWSARRASRSSAASASSVVSSSFVWLLNPADSQLMPPKYQKKRPSGKSGWAAHNQKRSQRRKTLRDVALRHHRFVVGRLPPIKPLLRINGKQSALMACRKLSKVMVDSEAQTDANGTESQLSELASQLQREKAANVELLQLLLKDEPSHMWSACSPAASEMRMPPEHQQRQ